MGGSKSLDGFIANYGDVRLFEFPSFLETGLVSHGFTTRAGGLGATPYDSLNLAFHVGDDPETVIGNRRIVCGVLGAELSQMVAARQVHGNHIAVVDSGDAGRGALSLETAFSETDGMVTSQSGLLLATFYADCVPIFILDPVKKVIATVHAGWKGTVGRIGAAALRRMKDAYGCNASDCLTGIGPSIGPCCYEVDEPVISRFRQEFGSAEKILEFTGEGKARLDLWQANRKVLVKAGVREDNVELSRICTCCNRDVFFSYRGNRGITGRMGAFIMLKQACL